MKKILLLTLMVLMFVGCQEESGLASISEKEVLVLGTSADYPPYEFHTEIDGEDMVVGFDMPGHRTGIMNVFALSHTQSKCL